MQITLTVPDKKANSFLDVLRHISYVKINDVPKRRSKKSAEDNAEEFYEGLKRAVHEVNEAIAGQKQLRSAEEWLDEFKSRAHC